MRRFDTMEKKIDNNDFNNVVSRAMDMIRAREKQMIREGYEWPIVTETCRWRIEQVIINRSHKMGMMEAAIEYVESIEKQAEDFNGIHD